MQPQETINPELWRTEINFQQAKDVIEEAIASYNIPLRPASISAALLERLVPRWKWIADSKLRPRFVLADDEKSVFLFLGIKQDVETCALFNIHRLADYFAWYLPLQERTVFSAALLADTLLRLPYVPVGGKPFILRPAPASSGVSPVCHAVLIVDFANGWWCDINAWLLRGRECFAHLCVRVVDEGRRKIAPQRWQEHMQDWCKQINYWLL